MTTIMKIVRQVYLCIGIVSMILWGGRAHFVRAQPRTSPSQGESSMEAKLAEGVHKVRAGKAQAAVSLLQEVFEADPGFGVAEHGAVAYWLGRAYATVKNAERAREVWLMGLEVLPPESPFDVRVGDAYLQSLQPAALRAHRNQAVRVYKRLVRQAGPALASAEQTVLRRHVAQMALLLGDDALGHVIHEARDVPARKWTFEDDAGTYLLSWWRRKDPLPATAENERLEEHLERVAYARAHYAYEERALGLDDRGVVYVKYGKPSQRRSIHYDDGKFMREVLRFGVPVGVSDFPSNEIWFYRHIDRSGYYIFAELHGYYQIAHTNELLPRLLRHRQASTERGINISVSSLAALRYIYRELALYHVDFSARYEKIEGYAGWQEIRQFSASAGGESGMMGEQRAKVGAGQGERLVFANSSLGVSPPHQFVGKMLVRGDRADRRAAQRREQAMPKQHTDLLDNTETLPLAMRTARFLTPNGTTRTEVYWGTTPGALQFDGDAQSTGASMVKFTAVQYGPTYQRETVKEHKYVFDTRGAPAQQAFVAPPQSIKGGTDLYHLALQWEQYPAQASAGKSLRLGIKRRITTQQIDTIQALSAGAGTLEMSDLKAMVIPDQEAIADPSETAQPYPFRQITPQTPLLLYFEVYHLGFNADDRTEYTVEYEVLRRTDRGGFTRLFRGDEEQRTTTRTTYEGNSRTAQEYIMLSLGDWEHEQDGMLRVTVRVTDEATGQQIERDIDFQLNPVPAAAR